MLGAGGKGGRGGRVGGEDAAGVGDGAEASERGSSAAAGGGRAVSPQPPTPSLSPLLSVTKVQENYANEDKRLSQRGSLPGLYFFGIRLRNYLTPCSEHFQLRGREPGEESSPDFGQFTSPATPKLRTSKPVSRGWDRASFLGSPPPEPTGLSGYIFSGGNP